MERAVLMQEKIAEQRRLPKQIKDKLDIITLKNLIISIALMAYLIAINMIYLTEEHVVFANSTKIFAMLLIAIDIVLFEVAYRKDNITLWIHGLELLICSVLILSIPYIYPYSFVRNYIMLAPVFFSIYYVGKAIFIHYLETKKYQNNLSDVKEIMKDEEEGYLDDINLVEEVRKIEKQKEIEKNIVKEAKKK